VHSHTGGGSPRACSGVARARKRAAAGARFHAPLTRWLVDDKAPSSHRARRKTDRNCEKYCFKLDEFLHKSTNMFTATSWGGHGSTRVNLRAQAAAARQYLSHLGRAGKPSPNTPLRQRTGGRFCATGKTQSTPRAYWSWPASRCQPPERPACARAAAAFLPSGKPPVARSRATSRGCRPRADAARGA
jgi:hypothetical protein